MYIPKQFEFKERHGIIQFMKVHSFATIVTVKDNFQTATHLPFVIEERDDEILLSSHFARGNDQWKAMADNQVLVIFTGPHAYINPKMYEHELNVPTWNYVAVHAYGKATIVEETTDTFEVLEKMINRFDTDYKKQWEQLPFEFKQKHVKGIVAFEVNVTDLQAKKKLSQNKSVRERQAMIDIFSKSNYSHEASLAEVMKNDLNK